MRVSNKLYFRTAKLARLVVDIALRSRLFEVNNIKVNY